MTKEEIIKAYCRIREIDHTIPDDVLDFMKNAALMKLQEKSLPGEEEEIKGFYCQSDIEDRGICEKQCNHCKEYYKPLENH